MTIQIPTNGMAWKTESPFTPRRMATLVISSDLERTSVEFEILPNGDGIWVARDLDLDGCLAQDETREAALAALEEARVQYVEALRALGRLERRPNAERKEMNWRMSSMSSRSRDIASLPSASITLGNSTRNS